MFRKVRPPLSWCCIQSNRRENRDDHGTTTNGSVSVGTHAPSPSPSAVSARPSPAIPPAPSPSPMNCGDTPAGWTDTYGNMCQQYVTHQWCNLTGYGPGWLSSYGGLAGTLKVPFLTATLTLTNNSLVSNSARVWGGTFACYTEDTEIFTHFQSLNFFTQRGTTQ